MLGLTAAAEPSSHPAFHCCFYFFFAAIYDKKSICILHSMVWTLSEQKSSEQIKDHKHKTWDLSIKKAFKNPEDSFDMVHLEFHSGFPSG